MAEEVTYKIVHQKRGFWFFSHVAIIFIGPLLIGESFGWVLGGNSLLWVWLLGRTIKIPSDLYSQGCGKPLGETDWPQEGIPEWSSDLARGYGGMEISKGRYVGWAHDDNKRTDDSSSADTSIDLQ